MSGKIVPNKKISDLSKLEKQIMMTFIVEWIKRSRMMEFCRLVDMEGDTAIKSAIELIDEGFLKVCTDGNDKYWMDIYDVKTKTYKRAGTTGREEDIEEE